VWMGQQAIEKRLIDHLGGLREALEAARAAGNLPDDAPLLEVPRAEESLIEKVLKIATGGGAGDRVAAAAAQLPAPIRSLARALAPLVVYRSDEPLARMEWVDAGDWEVDPP
jgi:protease-4